MREPQFLRTNKAKWQDYERAVFQGDAPVDPDHLADRYVQLTDDLAFARTFYPRSAIVRYLNALAARTHLLIYGHRRPPSAGLWGFWTQDLPLTIHRLHRQMGYALLMFMAFVAVGVFGALNLVEGTSGAAGPEGEGFIRAVLGDGYVDMTIRNIEAGNPTGVYQTGSRLENFLGIMFHNVKVAFLAFIWGVAASVGTVWILFRNGIMVGAFFALFYQYDAAGHAWPIIMIHGTLELAAICIAAGGGLALGNSWLFPGTYTRMQRLRAAAQDGVKLLVGLIPVFAMAAFLEGYVTRLAHMPALAKALIIAASAALLVWYYVLYPTLVARHHSRMEVDVMELNIR